jgi:hypothetical protein
MLTMVIPGVSLSSDDLATSGLLAPIVGPLRPDLHLHCLGTRPVPLPDRSAYLTGSAGDGVGPGFDSLDSLKDEDANDTRSWSPGLSFILAPIHFENPTENLGNLWQFCVRD